MSPVSRGRKRKQTEKSTRQQALPELVGGPDECDCPACTDPDFDPQQMIDDLLVASADLVTCEDPLDAEVLGAALVTMGAAAGEGFDEALVGGFVPMLEARATADALAMLLAIGSVAPGRAAKAASVATDRLVDAGVAPPGWASELGEPVTVADCRHLYDPSGTGAILACSFHRAGRSHAVIIFVDHTDCGVATDIGLVEADDLPEALDTLSREGDVEIVEEDLDAAEFRWQVEKALDARALHDGERSDEDTDLLIDEDGPGYPVLAVLLRARMSALPAPTKPAAPHGGEAERGVGFSALQVLEQLAGNGGGPLGAEVPVPRGDRVAAALPAKRGKSDRPAPVYQIKVGLRGAKPPIWRRLEVPADVSLARLHTILQIAFGWDDSHLHVFETPYGRFGAADAELGHRAEARVTLEQVAPAAKSRLGYTYDFGGNWDHDIVVEKVLDRDPAAVYPRCTGGRRAGPPEDCGGIWGYAELVEVLGDPEHPEHEERLEWLGLDTAADFVPDGFDAEEVTKALATLR